MSGAQNVHMEKHTRGNKIKFVHTNIHQYTVRYLNPSLSTSSTGI